MSGSASRFVWYELMTTDPASAREFYGKVIGWGAREAMPAPNQYTLFTLDGGEVAELMALPDEAQTAGARPGWIGYVGVPAVDGALAGVLERGGRQHVPPTDIPEVGRFAVVAELFGIGGVTAGGMFNPSGGERPFWLFYVAVSDIDAALARVTQAGGAVLHGPAQVPGGAWIVQATDPQGALFALVGMRPG